MILSPLDEMKFRRAYLDSIGCYDVSVIGLGNRLFTSWNSGYDTLVTAAKGFSTEEEQMDFLGYDFKLKRDDGEVLYTPGNVGTQCLSVFENRFMHSPVSVGVGVGYCGTPDPDIKVGDYVVVEEALVNTSLAAEQNGDLSSLVGGRSSPRVVDALCRMSEDKGRVVHKGKTITVQNFFSSHRKNNIKKYHDQVFLGIDMEAAYLLQSLEAHSQVERYRKEFGIIFLVTDNQAEECDLTKVSSQIMEMDSELRKVTRIATETVLSL